MTQQLVSMVDASVEPATIPCGTKVVAGYIGGDTPKVWPATWWQRFKGVKKLPIWTYYLDGSHDGWADVFLALSQLYRLGVPKGSPVAIDMETKVNPGYVNLFGTVLSWAGYRTWVYGSMSTVFGNPQRDGYWVAQWDNKQNAPSQANVVAKQYRPGGAWDMSEVKLIPYLTQLKEW